MAETGHHALPKTTGLYHMKTENLNAMIILTCPYGLTKSNAAYVLHQCKTSVLGEPMRAEGRPRWDYGMFESKLPGYSVKSKFVLKNKSCSFFLGN